MSWQSPSISSYNQRPQLPRGGRGYRGGYRGKRGFNTRFYDLPSNNDQYRGGNESPSDKQKGFRGEIRTSTPSGFSPNHQPYRGSRGYAPRRNWSMGPRPPAPDIPNQEPEENHMTFEQIQEEKERLKLELEFETTACERLKVEKLGLELERARLEEELDEDEISSVPDGLLQPPLVQGLLPLGQGQISVGQTQMPFGLGQAPLGPGTLPHPEGMLSAGDPSVKRVTELEEGPLKRPKLVLPHGFPPNILDPEEVARIGKLAHEVLKNELAIPADPAPAAGQVQFQTAYTGKFAHDVIAGKSPERVREQLQQAPWVVNKPHPAKPRTDITKLPLPDVDDEEISDDDSTHSRSPPPPPPPPPRPEPKAKPLTPSTPATPTSDTASIPPTPRSSASPNSSTGESEKERIRREQRILKEKKLKEKLRREKALAKAQEEKELKKAVAKLDAEKKKAEADKKKAEAEKRAEKKKVEAEKKKANMKKRIAEAEAEKNKAEEEKNKGEAESQSSTSEPKVEDAKVTEGQMNTAETPLPPGKCTVNDLTSAALELIEVLQRAMSNKMTNPGSDASAESAGPPAEMTQEAGERSKEGRRMQRRRSRQEKLMQEVPMSPISGKDMDMPAPQEVASPVPSLPEQFSMPVTPTSSSLQAAMSPKPAQVSRHQSASPVSSLAQQPGTPVTSLNSSVQAATSPRPIQHAALEGRQLSASPVPPAVPVRPVSPAPIAMPSPGPTSIPPSPGPTSIPPSPAPIAMPSPGPTSIPPSPAPKSIPPPAPKAMPSPGPTSIPPSPAPIAMPSPGPTSIPPSPAPTSIPLSPGPTSIPPSPGPTSIPPSPGPTPIPSSPAPIAMPSPGPISIHAPTYTPPLPPSPPPPSTLPLQESTPPRPVPPPPRPVSPPPRPVSPPPLPPSPVPMELCPVSPLAGEPVSSLSARLAMSGMDMELDTEQSFLGDTLIPPSLTASFMSRFTPHDTSRENSPAHSHWELNPGHSSGDGTHTAGTPPPPLPPLPPPPPTSGSNDPLFPIIPAQAPLPEGFYGPAPPPPSPPTTGPPSPPSGSHRRAINPPEPTSQRRKTPARPLSPYRMPNPPLISPYRASPQSRASRSPSPSPSLYQSSAGSSPLPDTRPAPAIVFNPPPPPPPTSQALGPPMTPGPAMTPSQAMSTGLSAISQCYGDEDIPLLGEGSDTEDSSSTPQRQPDNKPNPPAFKPAVHNAITVRFEKDMSCPVLKCPCFVTFSDCSNFIEHWNHQHRIEIPFYVCKICQTLGKRQDTEYLMHEVKDTVIHFLRDHPNAVNTWVRNPENFVGYALRQNPDFFPPGDYNYQLADHAMKNWMSLQRKKLVNGLTALIQGMQAANKTLGSSEASASSSGGASQSDASATQRATMHQITFSPGMKCPVQGCQDHPPFPTETKFTRHWREIHEPMISQYICRSCAPRQGFITVRMNDFWRHFSEMHPDADWDINSSGGIPSHLGHQELRPNPNYIQPGPYRI